MSIEYEAKFLDIDKDAFRKILTEKGYTLKVPEHMQRRQVYRVPDAGMDEWARVRLEYNCVNLAIKRTNSLQVDGTEETTIDIPLGADPEALYIEAKNFVEKKCRMTPTEAGEQENLRETWIGNDVEICIDTRPGLRPYAEIEAVSEQPVRDAATSLGFDFSKAIFGSVASVYEAELGISRDEFRKLMNLTFASWSYP